MSFPHSCFGPGSKIEGGGGSTRPMNFFRTHTEEIALFLVFRANRQDRHIDIRRLIDDRYQLVRPCVILSVSLVDKCPVLAKLGSPLFLFINKVRQSHFRVQYDLITQSPFQENNGDCRAETNRRRTYCGSGIAVYMCRICIMFNIQA